MILLRSRLIKPHLYNIVTGSLSNLVYYIRVLKDSDSTLLAVTLDLDFYHG